MKGTLVNEIFQLLESNPEGLSEFELYKATAKHPQMLAITQKGKLGLFQKHFLLMNALYNLQRKLLQKENQILTISALHICIKSHKTDPTNITNQIDKQGSVAAWYLDWDNYINATKETVQDLLDSFWKKYVNLDQRKEALKVLNLNQNASPQQIEHTYKTLIKINHPDKGGQSAKFLAIQAAWENLN